MRVKKLLVAITAVTAVVGGAAVPAWATTEAPGVVADAVTLEGARNFRDVGGYTTTDGRTVRTGVVFRSNKLSRLTDTDVQRLTALNVSLDVDLRNVKERHDEPDRVPPGARYQVADVVSLEHGLRFHDNAAVTLVKAIAAGLLNGSDNLGQSIGYPFMVDFVGADHAFGDLLRAIAANGSGATVFHCSAGKDRTGWGTAILLSLLGVPRAAIEADFMLSNDKLGDPKAVELSWLRAAFDEVTHLFGSMDAYARQGLRLDNATIDSLKARLLV
ncbi:tyrosine-protein phosphatase [Amycolatopsis umgeniensis]|uniref:Protein-tyrosine phosphatase n=1 Tax=Amycolatopsis umgeniensis TaxID=336628 RepID=A0A841AUA1_9PSEU|nr:tyrosine-protein phosphatase [Amycolatopsis umgeniensis]MBB5850523.1 protein-tyrosine phosphatase [Amycolatopsis umgeniensis]